MNKEGEKSFGSRFEAPLKWGGGIAFITGVFVYAPLAALGALSFATGIYVTPRKE